MEKSILRKQARIIRDEQDIEELKKKSKIILGKLYDLSCYKKAKNILTYVSTGSEADTRELIIKAASDKKKVYVPKVYGKMMKFHKINSLDELCPGYYGILEPDIHCEEWKSGDDNIEGTDLCVMPGLAFDNSFNRIGYGGGFYDRFLSKYPGVVKAALCYEFQMVDSISSEDTDIKPDWIITDMEVRKNG